MNISELIQSLESLRDNYGDLQVSLLEEMEDESAYANDICFMVNLDDDGAPADLFIVAETESDPEMEIVE